MNQQVDLMKRMVLGMHKELPSCDGSFNIYFRIFKVPFKWVKVPFGSAILV